MKPIYSRQRLIWIIEQKQKLNEGLPLRAGLFPGLLQLVDMTAWETVDGGGES